MLDLSKITQEYYQIKLPNKTILKLKKPTQSMLRTMLEIANSDMEETEMLDYVYVMITRMFNRNINDIQFTREDIEDMLPIDTAMIVLRYYMDNTLKDLGE